MFALMAVSAVLAYFVKGLCGFANTLVFSTCMGFFKSNLDISPIELVLGFPASCIEVYRQRRSVRLKMWLPAALALVAGAIPGILLLKNTSPQLLKVFFGIMVMALAVEMLLREMSGRKYRPNRAVEAIVCALAGLMCGLFGIGALAAAYFSRTTHDSSEFKGNLCAVFLTDNVFRIVMYSIFGILTPSVLLTVAKLLPFAALGLFLGIKCAGRISEKAVKKCVIVLLLLSGLSLLILNL